MPCNLFPHAYEKLIDEDIEWLKANSPDSLERDHILVALDFSKREYRARGYDEAMHKTGPHFPLAAAPVPQPGTQASQPVAWPREADPLTQAIQRLNSTAYNLTKDECIAVLRELRDSAPVAATQPSDGAKLADVHAPAVEFGSMRRESLKKGIELCIKEAHAGDAATLQELFDALAAAPIEAQAPREPS